MELEKEIKQKSFKNQYIKLLINILYTGNWVHFLQSKALRCFGLTVQQYNVLRILRGQYPNPCTVNLIVERMLDKSSNASRIVDRLLMKELVKRTQCQSDRRAVDVMITEKGLELLKKIDDTEEKVEDRFNVLTEEEALTMNRLLDKLRG